MLNRYKFPIEVLDYLSFEDIHSIRQPILNSNFIENYNYFLHCSVDFISQNNEIDILYNAQELMKIREALECQYKEIFKSQLSSYFKRESLHHSKKLLKNSANIGLGFLPIPNIINGVLGLVNEIKPAYFNIYQSFVNAKAISNYDYYIQEKEYVLKNYINKFDIREGTEMVDMIKLIQYTLSAKSII